PLRRDRTGCGLAAELDAAARYGARGLSQGRGAAPEARAPAERVRPAPDSRDAVPDGARRLDRRAGGRGGVSLLLRLPARRGRAESDPPLRGEHGGTRRAREAALLLRQLRRPDWRWAGGATVGYA